MKALVFKELREIAGIAAIALVCYVALVANLMGAKVFSFAPGIPDGTEEIPFAGSDFSNLYSLVTYALAAVIAFRQSAVESSRGTFLFLLHRPLSRDAIVLTKLAAGLGVLVASSCLPIVVYGWWAAIPGHHASPFEWSMTLPAWGVALCVAPWIYFGAFLSGIRPARWFGTRLLPLLAIPALMVLVGQYTLNAVFAVVGLSVGYIVFARNICYVARARDYA
jgi:hypothetical protein